MEFIANNLFVWLILAILLFGVTAFLQIKNMKDLTSDEFKTAQLVSTLVAGILAGINIILFLLAALAQIFQ